MAAATKAKRKHGPLGLPDLKRKSGVQEKQAKVAKELRSCPICGLDCGIQSDLLAHLFRAKSPGFKKGDTVRCMADPNKRGRVLQVDTDHRFMTVRIALRDGSHQDRRVLIWLLDATGSRARYFWMLDEDADKAAAAG